MITCHSVVYGCNVYRHSNGKSKGETVKSCLQQLFCTKYYLDVIPSVEIDLVQRATYSIMWFNLIVNSCTYLIHPNKCT